ncbi:MAG: HAMP domain-containing protein, partial [Novosphingobium sp.]
MISRFWPKSLHGQMLLTIALALLLAQGFGAVLLYRAQHERREAALVHLMAMRLFTAARDFPPLRLPGDEIDPRPGQRRPHVPPPPELFGGPRSFRLEHSPTSPARSGERRDGDAERELRAILDDQNVTVRDVVIVRRAVAADPPSLQRLARRTRLLGHPPRPSADFVLIGAIRKPGNPEWLVVRTPIPAYERVLLSTLLAQTLLIYAVLVGAIAFILRRITRPLATLTGQVERFAGRRDGSGQIAPEGPDDIRKLIAAHNAMEARIAALLDEKDVMLGAIGHDLKTPLAALRVRIESVENETERERMAATISDIAQSLDDILSLARAGRAREPAEMTELSALLAAVVEEYEDIGEPVVLGEAERLAMPLRATWLRRAIRNLIGNALRYGG